ncbi:hypothetical protein MJO28_003110 [Puccinia striiformis f. sp. tritici]|uniref:Uncharacterized protein n=1 Tax=Puccinia striiformis f. sp. tritici TaxID=168172 RepID=A0ACC0ESL0_9BASI|nr:hypothetical protein MJO28_003110 [Puccinia striiformis f. sp. tritici]
MASFFSLVQGLVQDGALQWDTFHNILFTRDLKNFMKALEELYNSKNQMKSFSVVLQTNGFKLNTPYDGIQITHPKLTHMPEELIDSWKRLLKPPKKPKHWKKGNDHTGHLALQQSLLSAKTWEGYVLDLVDYQSKTCLICGWDHLFNQQSKHSSALRQMKLLPYYKTFKEDVTIWIDLIG